MKVLVNEIPNNPKECIFCRFPTNGKHDNIHGNCLFKTRLWADNDRVYSWGYDALSTCSLYGNEKCEFLEDYK